MTRHSSGVRSFSDMLDRCRIDGETNCWVWSGGLHVSGVPIVHMPPGVMGPEKASMSARRACWILSGRRVRQGQAVYLAHCGNIRCINPQHCAVGKPGDAQRAAAKRGVFTTAERKAQIQRLNAEQAAPIEKVRAAEAELAEGKGTVEVARAVGLSIDIVQRVARGEHWHQRPRLLRGASVFALGAAS